MTGLVYLIPQWIRDGIIRSDYLQRIESGLDLVIQKAVSEDRNALIGELGRGQAAGALFELTLGAALVEQFGQGAVEPYPKIGDGKKKMDFAIERHAEPRLLVEAVTFVDDTESEREREYRRQHKIMRWTGVRDQNRDIHRVAQIAIQKATQRQPDAPFVLCICQYATWPAPDHAVLGISQLIAQAVGSRESKLVGCFYFHHDNLVVSHLLDARAKRLNIPSSLLSECRNAFNT